MSEEKEKFWVEGELNPDDLGEMIKMVREEKALSVEGLAAEIKVSPDTIKSVEEGRGAHVFSVLYKMCRRFKLKTTLLIKS